MRPRLHFANPFEERADQVGVGLVRCSDFDLLKFPSTGQVKYTSELNLLVNAAGKLTFAETLRPVQEIAVILTLSWLGTDYLIGFGLFSAIAIITSTFMTSAVNATEALMLNSENARNPKLTWSWMQLGLGLSTLFLLPISVTWWFSEDILTFMGYESHYAHLAGIYAKIFIPAAAADMWSSLVYRFAVVHRQGAAFIVIETAYTIILVFVLLVSIWGAAGFRGWGFEGAAYARIFCSSLRLACHIFYAGTLKEELQFDEIEPFATTFWSHAAFSRTIQVTSQHLLSQSLSEWLMPVFIFVAALHDITFVPPLILIEMTAFLFLGVAQGVATANGVRIGYFLRTGLAHHAFTAWKAAFTLTLPIALICGILTLYILPLAVPLYSDDDGVQNDVKDCKYILAGVTTLLVFVGTYASILFREGHKAVLACTLWFSSWALSLPLALICLHHFDMGLHSFWLAFSVTLIADVVILGPIVMCTDWQTVAEKCRLKQAEIAKARVSTNPPDYVNEKAPLSGLTENLLAQNYNAIVANIEPQAQTKSESSVEDLRVKQPEFSTIVKQPVERIEPDEQVLSQSIDSASTMEDLCVRRPDFSVLGRNTISKQRGV